MYKKGDTIAHNHHGVGKIARTDHKKILGTQQTLVTVYFDLEQLEITMSAQRLAGTARPVLDASQARSVLDYLRDSQEKLSTEYKVRNRNNHQRLTSGDPYQLCDVVVGLTRLRAVRGHLSHTDGEQLRRATEMLSSELGIALKLPGPRQDIEQEVLLAAAS